MAFRDSINNLIRSDKPESPTDLIFIFGSLILFGVWIFAAQSGKAVPHFGDVALFLTGCKAVKVAKDYANPKNKTT